MSVANALKTEPEIQNGRAPEHVSVGEPRWTYVILGLCFLPLVYAHFMQTLAKPHYQYVLLLPVVLYLAARRRLERSERSGRGNPIGVAAGLCVCWILLGAATVIWSPWLGMSAFLATCLVVLYAMGGVNLVKVLLPVWGLAWFALPLPFDLDERVTTALRTVTTRMSSEVLEQFGILHLRAVNVIQLPNKPLFIADACSGINSLFIGLAIAALIGVWNGRSLLHVLLLLATSFGLVLVENISRVVCIAVATRHGWDLAEGLPHAALGAGLFGATVVLISSTDQLLAFLFHRRRRSATPASDSRGRRSRPDQIPTTHRPLPRVATVLTLSTFIALACLQVVTLRREQSRLISLFAKPVHFGQFDQESMPEKLAGFQRKQFRFERRIKDDPMGEYSQAWTYEREEIHVVISLDYPYPGPKDLTECYEVIGWIVQDSDYFSDSDPTANPRGIGDAHIEATMRRPVYGHGFLLFSQCDRARIGWVRLRRDSHHSLSDRMTRRLKLQTDRSNAVPAAAEAAPDGSVFQVQVMARSANPFTADQKEQCRRLFEEAREHIYRNCLRELEKT